MFFYCNCLFCVAVFAPSVTDLVVSVLTSTTIGIQWGLPYLSVPTSYNISYTFTELYGANPDQGSSFLLVNHTDVTESIGVSPVVYSYLLVDLLAYSEYNISVVANYGEGRAFQPVLIDGLTTLQGGG